MKLKNVEEALKRASFCMKQAGVENPRLEAEIILSNLLETERLQLYLNNKREISSVDYDLYRDAVDRRANGEPLAYITGEKYFYGYRFVVNSTVLIPRPETELIIERALRWVETLGDFPEQRVNCLDLGTGSGILAITLALKLTDAMIWAIELSEAALHTAKQNAAALGVRERICFLKGSYFEPLAKLKPPPSINLIVANPPYVKKDDLEGLPRAVKFEPLEALYGGKDGLDGYRTIFSTLPANIEKPALLLLEIGAGQQKQVEELCLETGIFRSLNWSYDLSGHPRILEAVF